VDSNAAHARLNDGNQVFAALLEGMADDNSNGDLSPGKYSLASCFLSEVIATFFFLYVIIGTTSKGAAVGFAGLPIGLCLTLIHLFLIPVTNASVNPARSTGPALFAGGPYIAQLWLFWLAPILGAAVAGVISRWQHDERDAL
jgi:aquaporin Z